MSSLAPKARNCKSLTTLSLTKSKFEIDWNDYVHPNDMGSPGNNAIVNSSVGQWTGSTEQTIPWFDSTEPAIPWSDPTEPTIPWFASTEPTIPWFDSTEQTLPRTDSIQTDTIPRPTRVKQKTVAKTKKPRGKGKGRGDGQVPPSSDMIKRTSGSCSSLSVKFIELQSLANIFKVPTFAELSPYLHGQLKFHLGKSLHYNSLTVGKPYYYSIPSGDTPEVEESPADPLCHVEYMGDDYQSRNPKSFRAIFRNPRIVDGEDCLVFYRFYYFCCECVEKAWLSPLYRAKDGCFCRDCSQFVMPYGHVDSATPYLGPERCYGKFNCHVCNRTWSCKTSRNNGWEKCYECKTVVFPFYQVPNVIIKHRKRNELNYLVSKDKAATIQKWMQLAESEYPVEPVFSGGFRNFHPGNHGNFINGIWTEVPRERVFGLTEAALDKEFPELAQTEPQVSSLSLSLSISNDDILGDSTTPFRTMTFVPSSK